MASLGLRFVLLLGLIGFSRCGRSHQPLRLDYASPTSGDPSTVPHGSPGHCDAVLLSSLATFVTSGAGYAEATFPRKLALQQQGQLTRQQNSSTATLLDHGSPSNSSTFGGSDAQYDPTPPHKPLWPDWSQGDVWLFVLSAITLFIAAGGGIGGGAVFVPLFIIVGGFTAAQAVALSNITILGGAVANFLVNSTKRHAFRDTPLIDWDLILVFEPTTMLGALLGSYTNKLFPTWFTSCLMAALLVFLTWKLLMRGINTFVQETNEQTFERMQRQHQHQHADDVTAPLLANGHDQDTADAHAADTAAAPAGGAHGSSKPRVSVDGVSAWMDLDAAIGDQCPAGAQAVRHSSRDSDTGRASQHSRDAGRVPQHSSRGSNYDSAPSADADVLPIPAGLKPLTVKTDSTAAGATGNTAEGAALQRDTPLSGRAFSVEGTPKPSERRASQDDGVTSPILWSSPSSASAAEAEQVPCPFTQQAQHAQQKFRHQQQRRQALLLPRHSAGGGSGGGSDAKQQSRVCSLCSCLDQQQLKLSTVQAYTRQQLPWQPVLVLFFLSCWVVASDTGKATLACGSIRYWLVVLSVVPPCLLVTLVVRQWLLAKTAVEEAAAAAVGSATPALGAVSAGALAQQRSKSVGVIRWTPRNSIAYPLICSLAGVFAGLFGVGGGIVKGPLMLELGVLPDVAAATSATMIMFTAGSAAIVYVNFGGVVHDYAQALLLLGFLVTLAGQLVATHLVKVLKRRSIIIFAMGLLMLLASVAAIYQMGLSTVTAYKHPPLWEWGTICQHR